MFSPMNLASFSKKTLVSSSLNYLIRFKIFYSKIFIIIIKTPKNISFETFEIQKLYKNITTYEFNC